MYFDMLNVVMSVSLPTPPVLVTRLNRTMHCQTANGAMQSQCCSKATIGLLLRAKVMIMSAYTIPNNLACLWLLTEVTVKLCLIIFPFFLCFLPFLFFPP